MSIDSPKEIQQAKIRKQVADSIQNTDWHLLDDLYRDQTKRFKLKYDAAVAAGFTTDQALDLCWRSW